MHVPPGLICFLKKIILLAPWKDGEDRESFSTPCWSRPLKQNLLTPGRSLVVTNENLIGAPGV